MHRTPWLWEFHKVHHAAEVLTPFTLYRTHPVEAALHQSAVALTLGVTTGTFAALFGPELHAWHLLGVDALGALWTLAGANLRHSHVWLSYGPRVERFVLSPAQHQVHHSVDARHRDRNFGTALALWDAWCGSLYVTAAREPLRFGLAPGERPIAHTVTAMLLDPVIALAARLAPPLRRAVRALPMVLALLVASCTEAAPRVDRAALLGSFARCTVDRYVAFESTAAALATTTAAWATDPDDPHRAAARVAWERAIDDWATVDSLRFGPAADAHAPGGRDLRAGLYAWPDVDRCFIERQVVSRAYERTDLSALPVSARGLGAIEYLVFFVGDDTACAATDDAHRAAWSALSRDERTRRQAAYARVVADDVAARARSLVAAWGPAGFGDQLVTAGRGSSLFATQQSAISAVAEGLFALDANVREARLAAPLGLHACVGAHCPQAFESAYAGRGRSHLRHALVGARLLLQGCAAGGDLGFDDLLASAGAPGLAASVLDDLAAAEAAVAALPDAPLADTFVREPAALRRVHDRVKALTDALTMEFAVALQIQPRRVEGDND
jgi:predicted lipoprotein